MAAAKTYKKIEIVGTSPDSVSDAVENGLARAADTVRNIDWFEVVQIRGNYEGGTPLYQADLKIGFRLDDE